MNQTDLNIKCAEAMGWKNIHLFNRIYFGVRPDETRFTPQSVMTRIPTPKLRNSIVPSFTTSHDAAFTLIFAMRVNWWTVNLANGLDGTWECEFMRPPIGTTRSDDIGMKMGEKLEIHYGAAPTAPLAICKAFLKSQPKPTP